MLLIGREFSCVGGLGWFVGHDFYLVIGLHGIVFVGGQTSPARCTGVGICVIPLDERRLYVCVDWVERFEVALEEALEDVLVRPILGRCSRRWRGRCSSRANLFFSFAFAYHFGMIMAILSQIFIWNLELMMLSCSKLFVEMIFLFVSPNFLSARGLVFIS